MVWGGGGGALFVAGGKWDCARALLRVGVGGGGGDYGCIVHFHCAVSH